MCIIVCTFIKWTWKLPIPAQHYFCFLTDTFGSPFRSGEGAPSLGFGGKGGYKLVRQRKNNGLLAQIQLDPLVRCWLAGWPTKPLFGFPAKPSMWVWLKTKAQIFAAVQFAIPTQEFVKNNKSRIFLSISLSHHDTCATDWLNQRCHFHQTDGGGHMTPDKIPD